MFGFLRPATGDGHFVRHLSLVLLFCISASIVSAPAHAADPIIHYVAPGGNCGGMNPCYATIHDAVQAAADKDEIRVAAGSYSDIHSSQGVSAVVVLYGKAITLRGGYTTSNWTSSDPNANQTVIDPKDIGIGFFIDVLPSGKSGSLVIDGFQITNGNATEAVSGTDTGPAFLVDNTDRMAVSILNCHITGNTAEGASAGIENSMSRNMLIENCQIEDNVGANGISINAKRPTIRNNTIARNDSDGIFVSSYGTDVEITGNTIQDNGGSGIYASAIAGEISGNTVTGNTADDSYGNVGPGGGMFVSCNGLLIADNVIRDNTASSGGGIYVGGSSVMVRDNVVQENQTTTFGYGGGIYVHAAVEGSYIMVTSNQVFSNTAYTGGGGIYAIGFTDIVDNDIKFNHAQNGGGITGNVTGEVAENRIISNTAKYGGGIEASGLKDFVLRQNLVEGNQASSGDGGGMRINANASDPDFSIDGNQFINNSAGGSGGGVMLDCSPKMASIPFSNTVVAGNEASSGSGVYDEYCSATFYHSTIVDHQAGDGVGLYIRKGTSTDPVVDVANSIIAKNTTGVYVKEGEITMNQTLWGKDAWANGADTAGAGTVNGGAGDLQADPLFADASANDYHITENSPAVDKGVDLGVVTDMDGQKRPKASSQYPDLGADEYYSHEEAAQGIYLPMMFDNE